MGAIEAVPPGPADVMTPWGGFLAGSESVGAALTERDGTVLSANAALERLVGPVGSLHEVVVPAQGEIVTTLLADAGASWSSAQAGLVRGSGEIVDCKIWALAQTGGILVLAEPLRRPGDRLNALLLEVNEDLLGARRALSAQNRRLRELDELKNMFLASATHDLKTPLTSILGYAELLGEQPLPAEARRMALAIENSAHRVLAMINDLLGAASIMTGELRLVRSHTDLVTLVRGAVEGIQPSARAAQVIVTRTGIESAAAFVDERRVLQILDNLLSNAVKYSHRGGQVVVACEAQGHTLTVTVTDTGIGIPVGDQQQLFDRYFRAPAAVDRGIEGTGLGLANARSFAEAHGGSLTCTSEPGVGSTFTLTLPDGHAGDESVTASPQA
ncbi:sensor histidine kinase KdpD [Nocardioides sp.]|uniref:sensor histidine kinase n=1 Tax=Nocardioides sp. TaxID=35761 RepID=UPI0027328FED|nr:HAMP domain-containing sensor histidine kinase [Nocardioides sp.]MDP3889791.1 HAMP domain-containing sensor histidine kinase [Nocardioides sp.]